MQLKVIESNTDDINKGNIIAISNNGDSIRLSRYTPGAKKEWEFDILTLESYSVNFHMCDDITHIEIKGFNKVNSFNKYMYVNLLLE